VSGPNFGRPRCLQCEADSFCSAGLKGSENRKRTTNWRMRALDAADSELYDANGNERAGDCSADRRRVRARLHAILQHLGCLRWIWVQRRYGVYHSVTIRFIGWPTLAIQLSNSRGRGRNLGTISCVWQMRQVYLWIYGLRSQLKDLLRDERLAVRRKPPIRRREVPAKCG